MEISNKKILQVSKEIPKTELEELKYLCKERIQASTLERVNYFFDLFEKLKQTFGTRDEAVTFAKKILEENNRIDLSCMLDAQADNILRKVLRPEEFLVQREESEEILSLCDPGNDTRVVLVSGGPGIGKTEVINSVCDVISRNNQGTLIVQPIEGRNGTPFSDISDDISYLLSCRPSEKSSFHSIIRRLRELNQDIVLSLDVSKVPYRHEFFNDFWNFVKKIVYGTTRVKLLITARCKDSGIKINNFKEVRLSYLKRSTSKELLQTCCDCEVEDIDSVIDCCEGTPTLIVNYPKLVNLRKRFNRRRGLTLLLEQTSHVDEAFRMQIEGYTKIRKQTLTMLAAVPGKISVPLASYLLNEERHDVEMICNTIVSEHLLVENSPYFVFPPIIKHYLTVLSKENNELDLIYHKSEAKLSGFFVNVLFAMNSKFMALNDMRRDRCFDLMLKDQETDCDCLQPNAQCDCPMSRKVVRLYKTFASSFLWALEDGIKRPDSWARTVDCANETVSLLAKHLNVQEAERLYQELLLAKCEQQKDEVRIACTKVSIGFLTMYYHKCQTYPEMVTNLLEDAMLVLPKVSADNDALAVEIREVEAHCLSKLGHTLAANYEAEFKSGLKMLFRGKKIREDEIKKGRGSKALIAAILVDIANVYNHNKDYEKAKVNCRRALSIYREVLGNHPFTASTMSFLAEINRKLKNNGSSGVLYMLARSMAQRILGNHMDTARFSIGYGEVQHDKGQTALARTCLQLACEIGKHYFGFQESYSLRKRLAELSEGEEAEKLQNEADEMKELCSVERANVEQLGHMRVKRQKNSYVDKLKAILSRKVWFTLYQMLLVLLVIIILMVAYILLYRW